MKPTENRTHDDRWLLRARELLQQQASQPDPALQRRLQQIRSEATAPLRRRSAPWLVGLALAGASAALLLAVGLLRTPGAGDALSPDAAPTQAALRAETPIEQALTLPEEDLALLSGEVDYTLVEELEFYAWLEQQDHDS